VGGERVVAETKGVSRAQPGPRAGGAGRGACWWGLWGGEDVTKFEQILLYFTPVGSSCLIRGSYMQFITDNWKEIAGVLAALIAGGLVVKFMRVRMSGSSNYVDQRNVKAKGDVVGRDNNRNRRP
jgi:hypothetical protein